MSGTSPQTGPADRCVSRHVCAQTAVTQAVQCACAATALFEQCKVSRAVLRNLSALLLPWRLISVEIVVAEEVKQRLEGSLGRDRPQAEGTC